MENITRFVKVRSQPSDPVNGVLSEVETDNGFSYKMVEKPWDDNLPDLSSIPRPARYACHWRYSAKHGRFLYHIDGVEGRDACELHAANVQMQLEGCGALGDDFAEFRAGSIHPSMPPEDCLGVTNSGNTLEAFHKAMQDANGNQESFWLEIE